MRFIILAFLLCLPSALAATISGNVYDLGLGPATAIITITTTPQQRIVAQGSYSFEVPSGTYEIHATQYRDLHEKYVEAETRENITVQAQGTYRLDLILFPVVELDPVDVEDDEDPFPENPKNTGTSWLPWLMGGILVVAAGLFILMRRKKSPKTPDTDLEEIIAFIRKERRTTQKDIRKRFPHSEAKISLTLTQLETEGRIRKIKKGRGNVILYEKG